MEIVHQPSIQTGANPQKTHPNESNHAQTEGRVQNDCEVEILLVPQRRLIRVRIRCIWDSIDVLDGDCQNRVAQHPDRYQPCAERLVLIVQGRFLDDLLDNELRHSALNGFLELTIKVTLIPCRVLDYCIRVLGLLG